MVFNVYNLISFFSYVYFLGSYIKVNVKYVQVRFASFHFIYTLFFDNRIRNEQQQQKKNKEVINLNILR